jgi:putative transposase
MQAVKQFAPQVGITAACEALGVNRASFYRQQQPSSVSNRRPRPARSLSPVEQQKVLEVLHRERFVDQSPAEVYATLLDEGIYLCSLRTMYRILAAHDEVRERRHLRRHPVYQKPQLLATGPINSGPGTSPNYQAPVSTVTSSCMSFSMSSVAMSSAGWSPIASRRSSQND